ncbi:helix-turn-helix domain-containing protein [Stenotrophomonas tumulicola]|uniref:Helix-turn-helix transcriptional regulator n=1 Tax=Stenotrophomonas tumulicola TaxID=1685415 RepID=A0A7W3FKR6_9GAMM|nr:helix-turn-helix transcriptional regulator [Stenotrophomonas tumulicola]
MAATSTHLEVPTDGLDRSACLGPDGSSELVSGVIGMIDGRWKLAILFRLFERPSWRTLELKRDLAGISQKVLTQQLRELEADRLIDRFDLGDKLPHVEYRLSRAGAELLPVLRSMRIFAALHQGNSIA